MAGQSSNSPRGKGGNFATDRNPFANTGAKGKYPDIPSDSTLASAVNAILAAGAWISFGTTKDGGAIAITILKDDARHRTYCSNLEELHDALQGIMQTYL